MTAGRRKAGAGLAVVAAAALFLAGCGGGSPSKPSGGASTTPSSAASSAGTVVTAVEKEFSITLSRSSFSPATYTFKVENQGTFAHNLTIKGPGVDAKASPTVQGGQSGELTVTLQKGSYELWCSVDAHKDMGMDMTIKVG